jgi:hypothetical protein
MRIATIEEHVNRPGGEETVAWQRTPFMRGLVTVA